MKTIDAIASVLKAEGIEYLSCFPTTSMIEAAAQAGIRPIVCRQERVGVHIADGFSRVTNGKQPGVFAMQYGPGTENSFAGAATAFSDSVPMLLLPLGHPLDRQGVWPLFRSEINYAAVTKRVEVVTSPQNVGAVMRRSLAALKGGRPGPVMVEIPTDVAMQEVTDFDANRFRAKGVKAQGDVRDIESAAKALCNADRPVIHAGQGVLYAEATEELVELAELLAVPVMTSLLGKSGFPESHPLSLGCGTGSMPKALHHFLHTADLIFGIGCSFTNHSMAMKLPAGVKMIHATNDPVDLQKDYEIEHPIVGDAKLVLRQLIEACKDILGDSGRSNGEVAAEIAAINKEWLGDWMPKLTSDEIPISAFRVIWDLMQAIKPEEAIVTHDSGSIRERTISFYRSAGPRSFIGWGRSHALGTGLGLIIGAKLARPEKVCINFMGDAAFGMVGLDFETAVRHQIPIITVVLNNRAMAGEASGVAESEYQISNLGSDYADLARAMGGYGERIEQPGEIISAFQRARRVTEEEGMPVLLEFMTARESGSSSPGNDFKPV
ncbi:MAG: thiamine pyrophosphate-requiring protein [Candidatus Poribacteria bacterium]|nr:thiamine pyrophosphate-requiring protein [Candidatus Poribacteria bacterium]